jgi:Tat protein secretion system quality control protein TatD with DNase activity
MKVYNICQPRGPGITSDNDVKDDFEAMLERSRAAGVKSMVITGGSLKESKQALELAKTYGWYITRYCYDHYRLIQLTYR